MKVEIFGETFNLPVADPEGVDYIRGLAEHVDSMMRTTAGKSHITDKTRLAMLAALNIAAEYHVLKAELDGEDEETSGEEVRRSRADNVDLRRSRFKQRRPPSTEEDRQRNRERRRGHYTKRTYETQLQAIVNDKSLPAKERHQALLALGRVRGYLRAPR